MVKYFLVYRKNKETNEIEFVTKRPYDWNIERQSACEFEDEAHAKEIMLQKQQGNNDPNFVIDIMTNEDDLKEKCKDCQYLDSTYFYCTKSLEPTTCNMKLPK